MAECKSIFIELEEKVGRATAEDVALATSRIKQAEMRARTTGRYATQQSVTLDTIAAEKLEEKYKHLEGKTIEVVSTSNGQFRPYKVNQVRGVARHTVALDGVRYDTRTGISLDGSKEINVLGSEVNHSTDGFTLSKSVAINTVDDMWDAVDYAYNTDLGTGNTFNELHLNHLQEVIVQYENMIDKVGKDLGIDAEFLTATINNERPGYARGSANVETGKMRLLLADTKYSSNLEILAHELQHMLIETTLKGPRGAEARFKIDKLRKYMAKELDYTVFLRRIDNPNSEDIARAKAIFDYAFKNNKNPSSEFLAYATTNEDVMAAIGGIKMKDTLVGYSKNPNSKLGKLWNIIAKMINEIYSMKKFEGKTGREEAADILTKVLDIKSESTKAKDLGVLDKVGEWLSQGDKTVAKYTGEIDKETSNLKEELRESLAKDAPKRFIRKLWKIKALAHVRSFVAQNNIFTSMTRDSTGEDVGKFYDMFRQSKKLIDKTVYNLKQVTFNTLSEDYGWDNVDKSVRKAVKRVLLDTDYKAVGTLDDVVRIMSNDEEFVVEMEKAKAGLKKETIEAAEALGYMVATNSMQVKNGYVNATQIARMVEELEADAVVEKIDKIASMIALKAVGEEDIKLTLDALKNESTRIGIEAAMKLYYTHEEEVINTVYAGSKWDLEKASKQEHYVGEKTYYIVDEMEMQELVQKTKMESLGKHEELSRITGDNMYVVAGAKLDTAYTEGLMSVVQLKNEGDSLRRVLLETGKYTPEDVAGIIEKESELSDNKPGEYMIPEREFHGHIKDYRIRIKQSDKEMYLGLDNDIVHTVSHTIANLTHKYEAVISNKNALRYLHEFHTKYKNNADMKFVTIDKNSTGKLKEYWDVMPYYMKAELKKLRGSESLVIDESMLVDFFGYKDVSLANFIKSKRWKQTLLKAEKMIQETTSYWKKVIVTMTGGTIFGNLSSNMLVTMQHTTNKNPIVYAKKFTEIWEYLNKYQVDSRELQKIKLKKKIGKNVSDADIKSLEKSLEDNPVHVIMEDGQYNVLLEDIDLGLHEDKGILSSKIKDMLNKADEKDPRKVIKKVFNELYLTEDSKVYSRVLKLTLYGDVVNKVMIHMDNMENNKMSERESLRYVDRLFVNYAYLDNKYIKYLNDMGMVTFTKYFFRTMPALLKMAAMKPVTMFTTEASQYVTGVDLAHPIDQIYNPFKTLANKLVLWDEPRNVLGTILTPNIARPLD